VCYRSDYFSEIRECHYGMITYIKETFNEFILVQFTENKYGKKVRLVREESRNDLNGLAWFGRKIEILSTEVRKQEIIFPSNLEANSTTMDIVYPYGHRLLGRCTWNFSFPRKYRR